MAKKELLVTIKIEGIRETLAALNKLPRDAANELRTKATEISQKLSAAAREAATAEGRQAGIVAATVKARRDRVPTVVAGGPKRIGRNRQPAYKLLFGSEFGATRYEQYKPHLGRGSYWFFRTVEDNEVEIAQEWLDAADEIIRKFSGGGV